MNTNVFRFSLLAVALSSCMAGTAAAQEALQQQDQDVDAAGVEQAQAKGDAAAGSDGKASYTSLEKVEVTGSRLANGDVTSHTIVLTQEDIQARGVTSVEELIRTLPQNVATIGAITNERSRGPLADRGKNAVSNIGSLGVSAANLGGMGAGNTLILVNGRRIAGAAGIEDGFANLNGIPLSAVERVEINTDGSSAVYGADAMGGVINFILKKNYTGSTLTVQHENSSNDADSTRYSLYSGYAWGSGSISGTLDHSKRDPVNNWKSGYRTQNYSSYFNGDQTYDRRSFSRGLQPGVVSQPQYVYNEATGNYDYTEYGLTVPAGFTGVPTLDDLVQIGPDARRDYVPKLAGPESESNSLTLHFEQQITDRLSFFADGLYSRTKNTQQLDLQQGLALTLAPGQYYNPFPAYYLDSFSPGSTVYYYPEAELAAGELPPGTISNTSTSWNANAGFRFQFNQDTALEFLYTTSGSKVEGSQQSFDSLVSIIDDPTSPNGYRCYNYFLENNRYTGKQKAQYQAAFDRQCAALTSSDPDVAFNPWKSTAAGGGGSVSDFYYTQQNEQRTSNLKNYELRLTGSAFSLPAGKIYYALGGEYYSDGVDSQEVRNSTGAAMSQDRYAFFGEANVPIFGRDFNFPGLRELTLNVAARRDTYKTEGAIGTVDGIAIDQGGQLIIGKNTFAKTTPSFGFRWRPFEDLTLRGKWTQGFKAPPYTQLFSATGTYTSSSYIFNYQDPTYQCTVGVDCDFDYSGGGYIVPLTTAPNPNLKPQKSTQHSYSLAWQPSRFLQGLSLDVTYNQTKIHDEYADRTDLLTFMSIEDALQMAEFFPRDSTGRITSSQNMIFNIAGSQYESVTYELSYLFNTAGFGSFEPKITYLDNLKAERKAFPGSEPISTLGRLQGPDEYKVIGSLAWYFNAYSATLWAYYTPSYLNDYQLTTYGGVVSNADYAKPVDSFLTYDLTFSWKATDRLQVNFAGRNITNAKPPLAVVEDRPYDTARYNAAGRTLSLELQYSF